MKIQWVHQHKSQLMQAMADRSNIMLKQNHMMIRISKWLPCTKLRNSWWNIWLRYINNVIFWNHCQRGWWRSHAFRPKNSVDYADFNFSRRIVSSCNIWRFGIWIGQKGVGCYRIHGRCLNPQIDHCIFNRNAINDFWTSGKVLIFNIGHQSQTELELLTNYSFVVLSIAIINIVSDTFRFLLLYKG